MQPAVLRTLAFDRIVDAVRSFALTPMGDERLSHLAPSTDRAKVAQWLAATSETAAYLGRHGQFAIASNQELPQILDLLAIEGRALEALRLLALAAFLES